MKKQFPLVPGEGGGEGEGTMLRDNSSREPSIANTLGSWRDEYLHPRTHVGFAMTGIPQNPPQRQGLAVLPRRVEQESNA